MKRLSSASSTERMVMPVAVSMDSSLGICVAPRDPPCRRTVARAELVAVSH
jgi:hypothetical protein